MRRELHPFIYELNWQKDSNLLQAHVNPTFDLQEETTYDFEKLCFYLTSIWNEFYLHFSES